MNNSNYTSHEIFISIDPLPPEASGLLKKERADFCKFETQLWQNNSNELLPCKKVPMIIGRETGEGSGDFSTILFGILA